MRIEVSFGAKFVGRERSLPLCCHLTTLWLNVPDVISSNFAAQLQRFANSVLNVLESQFEFGLGGHNCYQLRERVSSCVCALAGWLRNEFNESVTAQIGSNALDVSRAEINNRQLARVSYTCHFGRFNVV